MGLIEGSHFFKTHKEESEKIVAKYLRGANKAYLDTSYGRPRKSSNACHTPRAKG